MKSRFWTKYFNLGFQRIFSLNSIQKALSGFTLLLSWYLLKIHFLLNSLSIKKLYFVRSLYQLMRKNIQIESIQSMIGHKWGKVKSILFCFSLISTTGLEKKWQINIFVWVCHLSLNDTVAIVCTHNLCLIATAYLDNPSLKSVFDLIHVLSFLYSTTFI